MIELVCPHCRSALPWDAEHSAPEVRCPKCRRAVSVADHLATRDHSSESLDATPESATRSRTPAPGSIHPTTAHTPADSADTDLPLTFLRPAQSADELGRLGDYRILRVLGHGGMGIVFLAEDIGLKRQVALKVIRPDLAREQTRRRFLREAQAAASVEHEHVVHIYNLGEDNGVPFLAMKLLAGESLDDRLTRERTLPIPEVLRIGREIAEGLDGAHAKGLIHRDVKPRNIWLEAPDASVRLLDFGLARATQSDVELTPTGAILGTPAYMAPEQAKGEDVDHRADLFNLGCVLYRMCTGQRPFRGNDTMSLLLAITTENAVAAHKRNPEVPPALSALIARLLAKNPEKRPESALEIVRKLTAIERDVDTGRVMPSRLKRYRVYGALVPFVAAILLVVYLIRPKEKPIAPPGEKSEVTNPKLPPVESMPKDNTNEFVLIKFTRLGDNEASERQEIETGATQGTLILKYDMFTIPDRLAVYYDDAMIEDTGLVSNKGSISVNYGPGKSTKLVVLVNEGRNQPGTTWDLDGRIILGHHFAPGSPGKIDPKLPKGGGFQGTGQFGNLGGQFGAPPAGALGTPPKNSSGVFGTPPKNPGKKD